MSDYDFRPGGTLKLKGGVAEGGIVKKCVSMTSQRSACSISTRKKKKSKTKSDSTVKNQDSERVKDIVSLSNDSDNALSGSGRNSPAIAGSSSRKTEAEKRFEEVQKRRVCLS